MISDEGQMANYREELIKSIMQLKSVDESPNSVHGLLHGKEIILYGAGDGLITFLAFVLFRYHLKAEVILDRKFDMDCSCFDMPASSPFKYRPTDEQKEHAVVVITVGKSEYHQEIWASLNLMGFKNIIHANEIYEYHLPCISSDLKEKQTNYYTDNRKQILESLELFRDDESRDVYFRFMQTHLKRTPAAIPSRPLEEQYFPEDIPMRQGKERVINCGSYNGDTAIKILLSNAVHRIACFEPDLDNFRVLRTNLEMYSAKCNGKVILFPCGVYSSEIQFRFSGGKRINSMISPDGETVIQCVALDHALPHFAPSFINMDVEGAEFEAIRGSEILIRESRPDLAICVYHSPSHIWEIPLFIDAMGLGYKFYLRNYTSHISETVLYAAVEQGKR
jgi:FkbM family methyltransferase